MLQEILARILNPQQAAPTRLAGMPPVDPIYGRNQMEGKVGSAYDVYGGRAMEGVANNGQRLERTPTGQIVRYAPSGPIVEQAPMTSPQGMQAPQQPPQRQGGGFLERIFNPQGAQKNQTVQFLTQQGMDEGTATLVAGNKQLLQQYLAGKAMPDPEAALKRQKLQLEVEQMRQPTTDDVREYQFARDQGYKGSFTDFMQEMKKAGAQNITIGGNEAPGLGKLSADYGYVLDPQTRQPVIDLETGLPKAAPVPGSPAAVAAEQEALEAENKRGVQAATDLGKAETMLDATSEIKKLMEEADTPVTGTLSRPFAQFSGTAAGKVRSYVGALKSGVALNAIMRLKEASAQGATGFGAMNEKELQLLIDDVGALDADTTDPEIFAKTVDRIENRFKRVIEDVKRNVDPKRIRELGLDALIAGVGQTEGDQGEWQDMGDGVKLRKVK